MGRKPTGTALKKGPFYKRFVRPVKHAVGFFIIRILIWKIRILPRSVILWSARIMGSAGYRLLGKDRRIALSNLKIAFPEKSNQEIADLAKVVFRRTAMNLVDIAIADRLVNSEPPCWRVVGREHLEKYSEKYGGGIVITGHIGCFELIPGICAKLGYKVGAVGRELYDPRINEILVRQRERMGAINIPSDVSPRRIIRLVREDYLIGILMDTFTKSVDGRRAPFFGLETRTISGPIALSLHLKKPPLPMAIYREGKYSFVLEILPLIELADTGDKDRDLMLGIGAANRALEGIIRSNPQEWIWHHPRFRDVVNVDYT